MFYGKGGQCTETDTQNEGCEETRGEGQPLQVEEHLRAPEAGQRRESRVPPCPQKEPPSQGRVLLASRFIDDTLVLLEAAQCGTLLSSLRNRTQPDTVESAGRDGTEMQGELEVY